MSIQFLLGEEQLARFDQAEAILDYARSEGFAVSRALFAAADVDIQPALDRLEVAVAAGRPARAQRESIQARFEAESAEVGQMVEAADKWIKRLHARVRFALAARVPGAEKVGREMFLGQARPESLSEAVALLEKILTGESTRVLPPSLIAEGHRVLAALRSETFDARAAEMLRQGLTMKVHDSLDLLGDALEELVTAAELVEVETGKAPPGFDLARLRGAAGRAGGTQAEASAPSAAPLPPMGVLPTLTAPPTNG